MDMGVFSDRLRMTAIQVVPFIMAVVFHEFAHGYIAHKWGDDTAKDNGRLTLNPLPHLDPIGTVLFPLLNMILGINWLFGWAKPVPIRPGQFHHYRKGLFWVSLAGPAMNVILAVGSGIILGFLVRFVPETFYLYEPFKLMAMVSIQLNFALCIFNLIPLPPLDGSKIVDAFLPYRLSQKYAQLGNYSFFILMALMFTGGFAILSYPINFLATLTVYGVGILFQL